MIGNVGRGSSVLRNFAGKGGKGRPGGACALAAREGRPVGPGIVLDDDPNRARVSAPEWSGFPVARRKKMAPRCNIRGLWRDLACGFDM